MKTTIDLPEELLRRTEAEAAVRGMKVEDLVAHVLDQALPKADVEPSTKKGMNRPFPFQIKATGQVVRSFTNGDLDEIELQDTLEKWKRA